jgi:two-component system, cell cycle response regulator
VPGGTELANKPRYQFKDDRIKLTAVIQQHSPPPELHAAADAPRLLLAEDSPMERQLLESVLQQGGYVVECAEDGLQALEKITREPFHILLTDWEMPGLDGAALSRRVREAELPGYVYILLLTGHGSSDLAVDALSSGADNFIRKPVDPAELLAHVNAGCRIVQLERSLRAANEEIRRLTITDPLVGTFNRRHLDAELAKEVERARRYGHCLSTVMADLDRFKQINDHHGHIVGDEVLREFAWRARASIRQGSDWIARFGGEEFVIVLPETPLAGATATAEKIRALLQATPIITSAGPLTISASFGVAALTPSSDSDLTVLSPAGLLRRADRALYRSKLAGRNRVMSDE